MLEKQLQNLGFHKNEIKVYLALFELGQCKAGDIILHTKLHRNLVYTALNELEKRELISKTLKGGVAEFIANDPKHLLEEIENKKQLAQTVVKELKSKQLKTPREVKVYEGIEGLQKFKEKSFHLKPNDPCYVISTTDLSETPELTNFWKEFHTKRAHKNISTKFLFDRTTSQEAVDWQTQLPHTEAKYLPFGTTMPIWLEMFGDYFGVGFPGKKPIMVSIKSKETVDSFKDFFKYFWNQEVSVQTGYDALKNTIYKMLDELKSGEHYDILDASAGEDNDRINQMYDKFHVERFRRGIKVNMLVYKESYERIKRRFLEIGDKDFVLSKVKTFSTVAPIPMQINLYNNKTFFIIYSDPPTVINFERREVFDSFQNYFNSLWEQETQVLSGAEVVNQFWYDSFKTGKLDMISARGYFVDKYPDMFDEVIKKAKNIPGLRWRNIVDEGCKNHRLNQLPWIKTKYTLTGSKNPNVTWILPDKVAIVNWDEDVPVAFISTNKHMIESYHDYFTELWDKNS